jgi:hypothetical protein
MAQKPGGFHAALKGPLDLSGGEVFLGRVHQVDGLKPDMQRHATGLEDGPHADNELLPAGVALIESRPSCLATKFPEPVGLAAVVTNRTRVWLRHIRRQRLRCGDADQTELLLEQ